MRLLAPLCSVVVCSIIFYIGYLIDSKDTQVDLVYIVASVFFVLNHIVGLWYAVKVKDQGFVAVLLVSMFPIAAIGSILLPLNGVIRIVLGQYGSALYMIALAPMMWVLAKKSLVRLRDA